MKLLNIDKNAKTIKGQKMGYLTGILYMAPANISGFEVCPNSSAGCRSACLNTAGRGAFSNAQKSRYNKTRFFFENKQAFMEQLVKEISALKKKARKENKIPVIRLNGTSDINFLKTKFKYNSGPKVNLFQLFPFTQFYDYTKNYNMLAQSKKLETNNYHLTFSYSGENKEQCKKALKNGFNVSWVFKTSLPTYLSENTAFLPMGKWKMHPKIWTVLDGDKSDLRFLDKGKHGPFIIGLIAKGKARKQHSSFIN